VIELDIPIPTRWITELPGPVGVPPIALGADLCVRSGDALLWLDPETGAVRAQVGLGTSAIRLFLLAVGDRVLVDRQHGRTQATWVDIVHGGAVERTVDLECIVGLEGAVVSGSELFVMGNEGPIGPVLRSIDPLTGVRRVDQRIVPNGRDVFAVGDRLLILNSTGEPGLISVDRNGGTALTIEQTSVQSARIAAGRVMVGARIGEYPEREARVRDLATGELLWSAPAHGPVVALDAETAIHVEADGDALISVARDAIRGTVQWRGAPLAHSSGWLQILGARVTFTYGYGTQLFRRGDGSLIGEVDGRMAAVVDGVTYLAGRNWIARCT
jgi:hypothetical protein